jgi:maltose phosphorylase
MASLDLNTCTAVKTFVATEYEGWYNRSFEATLQNGTNSGQYSTFLSIVLDE